MLFHFLKQQLSCCFSVVSFSETTSFVLFQCCFISETTTFLLFRNLKQHEILLFQCCFNVVLVLFQCCFSVVSVLFQCRFNLAAVVYMRTFPWITWIGAVVAAMIRWSVWRCSCVKVQRLRCRSVSALRAVGLFQRFALQACSASLCSLYACCMFNVNACALSEVVVF